MVGCANRTVPTSSTHLSIGDHRPANAQFRPQESLELDPSHGALAVAVVLSQIILAAGIGECGCRVDVVWMVLLARVGVI